MSSDRFSVLFVCTGNICRSPQAERLLVSELKRLGLGEAVVVTSAGTSALEGRPMEPEAATLTGAYGGDSSGHVARRLTEAQVAEADLVLTMERAHRADAVRLLPRASRYAFTLREFERLAVNLETSGGLDPVDTSAGAAQRFRDLIPQIAARRGMVTPVSARDDEVDDPYRRSGDAYERSARQIASSVSVVATTLVQLAGLRSS